jgi:hypothetical protein
MNEAAERQRQARDVVIFAHVNFVGCIVLERFGIMVGDSSFFFSGLIFLASVGVMLVRGSAVFDPVNSLLYLLVCGSLSLSTFIGFAFPWPHVELSLASFVGLVVFNSFFVVKPRFVEDRKRILGIYTAYVRACAIIGIVQFCLQFAGVKIFTLSTSFPVLRPILAEANYNTEGILQYGSSIHRANGLFLLEPSILSQVIAIAVLIDAFILKRFLFLPIYGLAYLLTFSGTGALCLILTLVATPILIPRQAKYVLAAALVALPIILLIYLAAPGAFDMLLSRTSEVSKPGTSGYMRYAAQHAAWLFFSDGWRLLVGAGPGAYTRFPDAVAGTDAAAVKLYSEYGALGLALFLAYVVKANWNPRLPLVSLMVLMIYQFGGGNLMQTFTLVIMALLTIWTGQEKDRPPGRDLQSS